MGIDSDVLRAQAIRAGVVPEAIAEPRSARQPKSRLLADLNEHGPTPVAILAPAFDCNSRRLGAVLSRMVNNRSLVRPLHPLPIYAVTGDVRIGPLLAEAAAKARGRPKDTKA